MVRKPHNSTGSISQEKQLKLWRLQMLAKQLVALQLTKVCPDCNFYNWPSAACENGMWNWNFFLFFLTSLTAGCEIAATNTEVLVRGQTRSYF